jgi:hypothetical protein
MELIFFISDDGRFIISGSEDCHTYIWRTEQSSGSSPLHQLHESRNKAISVFGHVGGGGGGSEPALNFSSHHLDCSPSQQQTRISKWLKRKEDHSNDAVRSRSEYFAAHDYVVTTGIFAPTKTRQYIAKSRQDTIYNNTPFNLRRLSTASSSSHSSSFIEDDVYPDGHILVTADLRGFIRVWRVDSGTYGQIPPSSHIIDTQSVLLQASDSSSTTTNTASPTKTRRNFGLFSSRQSTK